MVAGFAYTQAQDITITVGTARGTQQNDAESGRSRPFERAATTTSTDVTGTWTSAANAMTGVVLQEAGGGGGSTIRRSGFVRAARR
jgi:Na+/alanine symporter